MGSYRRPSPGACRAAHGADGAVATTGAARVAYALGEDPEAGKGPVEPHRVRGIDLRKPPGGLSCRTKVGRRAGGEAEVTGNPVDVSVHREEEARRGEDTPLPEPEVDVVVSDHPAKEEVSPLARTASGGGGEEKLQPSRPPGRRHTRSFPEHREETIESSYVVGTPIVSVREEATEGAFGAERLADDPQEWPEGSGIDPPVDEALEARPTVPTPAQGRCRLRPEGPEELFERGVDRGDAPEGEGGREERRHFAVVLPLVTVRKEKGIGVEASTAPGLLEISEVRGELGNVRDPGTPFHRAGSITAEGSLSDPSGGVVGSIRGCD